MEASSSTRRTDTSVSNAASADASGSSSGIVGPSASSEWPLDPDEYLRYGRQMIMPEWGLSGQLKLKNARVAVIGAGGLGCPVLQYLVGAGMGSLSIFDHDTVSASNLHRQVLHNTERVGMAKVLSACVALKAINPHVELIPHAQPISPSTALAQLSAHDLIIDCTDRPYTRYLVSDAAAALDIPLVSGAAVGAAGQWAVYGGTMDGAEGTRRRACYRCMWPKPGASARCDDTGVWGPVTGMVGSGMAAAALAVLLGTAGDPVLHVLHLGGSPMVRTVRMRGPRADCRACGSGVGAEGKIDVESEDYVALCGAEVDAGQAGRVPGTPEQRIDVEDLRGMLGTVVVVDTRPPVEYAICALRDTTNIPLATILATPSAVPAAEHVVFLCRRGNDSQIAAAALRTARPDARVQDVRGGLGAWTRWVDPSFPVY